MDCRIEVEYASPFPTAVASENVLLQLDVQVGFCIIAERTPAMKLCSRIAYDMNADEFHDIFDTARQIAVDTQF